MRVKAYIRTELNKGYIPSDKISYHGQTYESTSDLNIADVRGMWKDYRKVTPFMRQCVNDAINMWLRSQFGSADKTGKLFYLNFNSDGIDVFVARNIYD